MKKNLLIGCLLAAVLLLGTACGDDTAAPVDTTGQSDTAANESTDTAPDSETDASSDESESDTDPAETDPVETDPAETDPVETDPVETDPAETDPAETDPAETDPVETEPSLTPDTLYTHTTLVNNGQLSWSTVEAGTDEDGTEYAHLVTTGDDPYIMMTGNAQRYVAFRYRTDFGSAMSVYTGYGSGPDGAEVFGLACNPDEMWHTTVLDLGSYSQVTLSDDGMINYFRLDIGGVADKYCDIEYIAFFASMEDAHAYAATRAAEDERIYTPVDGIRVEGESFVSSANADGQYALSPHDTFSNGSSLYLTMQQASVATAAPSFTYEFEVETAGTYTLTARSYGFDFAWTSDYSVEIDGVTHNYVSQVGSGLAVDQACYDVHFGTVELTAGKHTVVITLDLEDSIASNDRFAGRFDYFEFNLAP